jgi:NitT/TauT family transport system substrate-binding protein
MRSFHGESSLWWSQPTAGREEELMHRFGRTVLVVIVLALATATAGCGGGDEGAGGGETTTAAAAPTKVRLAFSTWNGYIALVVGVKEGFYKKHGADVSYTVIEDPVQRFNAFKAGRLEAIASTTDTFSRTNAKGIKSVMVLGVDASVGGDGIVSDKKIAKVEQLKGQKVGVSSGSVSQWFLAYVLDQHGLSLDDVKQVDMTAGDAGAAFAAGRIPVAATWQPWLSRAEKNPNGHVLVDTKTYPDIITDQVAFQPDFIEEHPDVVRGFIEGYAETMDFIKTNEAKAFADVEDFLKQKPDEIKAIMTEVPLWTIADNKKFYGTADSPGPIYDVFDKASQFWKDIGEISTPADAKEAIDPSFVNEVGG